MKLAFSIAEISKLSIRNSDIIFKFVFIVKQKIKLRHCLHATNLKDILYEIGYINMKINCFTLGFTEIIYFH